MADVLTRDTWVAGTEVTLLHVPWDASYRDVVAFEDEGKRDEWFRKQIEGGTTYYNKAFTYLRPNEPVTVPVAYSSAYKYNYCVVRNPAQPVPSEGEVRSLYYFITGCEYNAPEVSTITLQLDVMMTYQFQICLGNMFVESGHLGVSNANVPAAVADLSGDDLYKYMTVPEGLDVGAQYATVARDWFPMNEADDKTLGRVIVVSTVNLAADPGTVSKPNLNVADGQSADGLPSACNVYSLKSDDFKAFMAQMQQRSWAAQGIVSVSTFPARLLSAGPTVELFGNSGVQMNFLGETDSITADAHYYTQVENVFEKLDNGFPTDAGFLHKRFTYPYSVIELTSFSGNSLFLKPELIRGSSLALYAIGCALAPFARVAVFPDNYGGGENAFDPNTWEYVRMSGDGEETGLITSGDFLDSALWLGDFPQFSLVNNAYITYMASTANTRRYQYESAGWARDRAAEQAQLAYSQAGMSLSTNQANYDASLAGFGANVASTAWTSPIFEGGGITTPSISDLVGMTGAGGWGWDASNVVDNLTGKTGFQNMQRLGYYNRDTNRSFADFANRGDYRNAIAGINATVQDAALTPPSTVGQMGGAGFNWKNGLVGFAVNYKTAGGAQMRAVLDTWRRYGYKIHRFVDLSGKGLRDLRVMSKYSYWQVLETYLTCAAANESETAAIRGVLEKGVTIWSDPDDIGSTPVIDNVPLRNLSY